jgi:AcrR family transcriptional regulator
MTGYFEEVSVICFDQTEKSDKDENIHKMILDRAQDLFFVYGYNSTTTEQIANDLGISKKTLYKFFPKKEDLFRAVIDRVMDDFNSKIDLIIGVNSLSFVEKASSLGKMHAEFVAKAPVHYQRDIRKLWPDWNQELRMMPSIEKFLRQGVDEGYFRSDIDVHLLIVFMQVSIRSMIEYCSSLKEDLSDRKIMSFIPTLCIEGFLTDKGRDQFKQKK